MFYWRIHAYDSAIVKASALYGVDARLIRAVIWKESRFNPKCVGKAGEIGLMQVTPAAAGEAPAATDWKVTRRIPRTALSTVCSPPRQRREVEALGPPVARTPPRAVAA